MDFSQDNLTSVIHRIARRGSATYPSGSWDQIATFTALRQPKDFDIAAFRRFQERLREITGIEAIVVGGENGCIRLFVKLVKSDKGSLESTGLEVSADFPHGRGDDAARLLSVILATHPEIRALAASAGIDRVQTRDTAINMRTGDVTPYGSGISPPPYIDLRTTVVQGSVGQIGDNNSQAEPRISGRADDQDDTRPEF